MNNIITEKNDGNRSLSIDDGGISFCSEILASIAVEIWDRVLSYLSVKDLLFNVTNVCKCLMKYAQGEAQWQQRLQQVCPRLVPPIEELLQVSSLEPQVNPELQGHLTSSSSDCRFLISSREKGVGIAWDCGTLWMEAYRTEVQRRQRWSKGMPTQRYRFKAHADGINSLALKRTSARTMLASASFDRTIKIWLPYYDLSCSEGLSSPCLCGDCLKCSNWVDVHNSTPSMQLEGHRDAVWALNWVNDNVLSASFDRTIRLWDMACGQEKWCGQAHAERVLALACRKKDGVAATGGRDGIVHLWDVREESHTSSIAPHPATPCIYSLGWVSEHILLTGTHEGLVLAFDTRFSGLPLWHIQAHGKPVLSMSFSEQRSSLLTTSKDNTFALHRFLGQEMANPIHPPSLSQKVSGHKSGVRACAVVCESSLVASASNDHLVKLWAWTQQYPLVGNSKNSIKPCGEDEEAVICESSTRQRQHLDYLESNQSDRSDAQKRQFKCIKTLRYHQAQVTSLCCDEYLLISGSIDGTINLQCFGTA
mmetsp:Transcript_18970/g.24510  ORF Transcript_18970/g.24510 Transcript_18970/m.24510 type:complete len:536 (-) Transcript_18970:55-1662(-)